MGCSISSRSDPGSVEFVEDSQLRDMMCRVDFDRQQRRHSSATLGLATLVPSAGKYLRRSPSIDDQCAVADVTDECEYVSLPDECSRRDRANLVSSSDGLTTAGTDSPHVVPTSTDEAEQEGRNVHRHVNVNPLYRR